MKAVATASLVVAGVLLAASVAPADEQSFPQIERGRYLATVGDCAACHTAPGGRPFAGGLAIETPFGSIVTPNITPDRETGIGAWNDNDFLRAMQQGIGPDGRHLYPAFPYPNYTKVSRDDVVAIRAYLATLEPVKHQVESNTLPFPFNIRASMVGWNALFFDEGRFQEDESKSDEWNRGAYLIQGLGHCSACHTPKNALGGDKTSVAYSGGLLQGWFVPDITANPRYGVGGWSESDIVAYLQTGHNQNAAATGPMAEVVEKSTSRMSDDDLHAMAMYLKTLGSQPESSPAAPDQALMTSGRMIYENNCTACHKGSGAGVAGLFPALAHAPNVQSTDATTIVRVLLEGAKSASTDAAPTGPAMPSFGWKMSDDQIAAVATYIRNAWGNRGASVAASSVRAIRSNLSKPPN
jgi:mono/diheme cytochrome c family protein